MPRHRPQHRPQPCRLIALLGGLGVALSPVRASAEPGDEPGAMDSEQSAAVPDPGAYHFEPTEICPFCELTPGYPDIRRGLHWHQHWRRVGVPEFVSTPVLLGTTAAIEFGVPEENDADWSSPILFDGAARDALVFDSPEGRRRSRIVSDALFWVSVVHPVVVDNLLITWFARQSPEVAWEIFVINAQAYSLTLALTTATKRIAGRERPWGERCPEGSETGGEACGSGERFRSFYSGHAAVTATGAGLMCAHHTQLELYKNPVADTAACLSAVAFTAATGVLRMTSDNHWASDVLLGHFVGYVSGYLLPTLLYYREFRITPEPTPHVDEAPPARDGPILAVVPTGGPGMFQLSAIGMF